MIVQLSNFNVFDVYGGTCCINCGCHHTGEYPTGPIWLSWNVDDTELPNPSDAACKQKCHDACCSAHTADTSGVRLCGYPNANFLEQKNCDHSHKEEL